MRQQGNQKGKVLEIFVLSLSLSLSLHFFGKTFSFAKIQWPNRSAYVEFMRKEAADNALSLDGTSFMSRILKVFNYCSLFFYSTSFLLIFAVQLANNIDIAVLLGYGGVFCLDSFTL